MSFKEDRWFEIWFTEGEESEPSYLLVVTPDVTSAGKVKVLDPQENYKVIRHGYGYEETRLWLLEDEYYLVEGRNFSDE